MVGPRRAVFLRPAAELAPHLDHHPVVEAARFEVALEGEDPFAGFAQVLGEVFGLVGVGVVAARGAQRHHPHRQAPVEVVGEPGELVGEFAFG